MTDNESDDQRPKRVVYEHEIAALSAIHDYRAAKLNGQVTDRHVRELAQRALDYREVLHKYRSKDALDPEWDERPIHWIEEYQNRTVQVEQSSGRLNNNTTLAEKPAILSIDPERLVYVIRELEDISDELGFSATISESTPRTKIDNELIEEVEEWRQKNLE